MRVYICGLSRDHLLTGAGQRKGKSETAQLTPGSPTLVCDISLLLIRHGEVTNQSDLGQIKSSLHNTTVRSPQFDRRRVIIKVY